MHTITNPLPPWLGTPEDRPAEPTKRRPRIPDGKPWRATIANWPTAAQALNDVLADVFATALRGKTAEALAYLATLALIGPAMQLEREPPPFSRYPWRAAMRDWDETLRAEWGRRAAASEEAGTPWPDSERQAYDQIQTELHQ
jgi:hypothetical protein